MRPFSRWLSLPMMSRRVAESPEEAADSRSKLGRSGDRREGIPDLVSETRGELPHPGQAIRDPHALLHLPDGGQVLEDHHAADRASLRILHRRGREPEKDLGAVGAEKPDLRARNPEIVPALSRLRPLDSGEDLPHRLPHRILPRHAENGARRVVHQVHLSLRVDREEAGRDVVDHLLVEALQFPDHVVPVADFLLPLPDLLAEEAGQDPRKEECRGVRHRRADELGKRDDTSPRHPGAGESRASAGRRGRCTPRRRGAPSPPPRAGTARGSRAGSRSRT